MANITNLVFQGGGVKGIAYAGALSVLESMNILQGVQRTAGTSAGAITAALVALKYSAEEVHQLVQALDFGSFKDHEFITTMFKDYGLHPGDTFLTWMQERVANSPLNKSAAVKLTAQSTFQDIANAGGLELKVFASDIYMHQLREFSTTQTPGVIVAEAVRASMSIPIFFNAWQFPTHNPDDHIYVDGGMVYNYPIDAFDTNGVNTATLGFRLEDIHNKKSPHVFGFGHWEKYVKNTFETMLSAQNINTHRDPEQMARSVVIDDLGIGATDFDLTKAQQQALYESGIYAAKTKLSGPTT